MSLRLSLFFNATLNCGISIKHNSKNSRNSIINFSINTDCKNIIQANYKISSNNTPLKEHTKKSVDFQISSLCGVWRNLDKRIAKKPAL